jgi:hypothetical protein
VQLHPACAACKHQRRRCAPGCPLAPYFPADKNGSFRNCHRLFGIKNIGKFMKLAGPEKQEDCMKSIMYEADARAASPVLGAYGVYQDLCREVFLASAELQAVQEQLARHRPAPPVMQPLLYAIPVAVEHQQPLYGGGFPPPPGALRIDGDATVAEKADEDDDHNAGGRTRYGGDVPSSSSSHQPSNPSPRRLLKRRRH